MQADLLSRLSRKIQGSEAEQTTDPWKNRYRLNWGDGLFLTVDEITNTDCGERPAECFDLLNKMEAAGFYPSLNYYGAIGYECAMMGPHDLRYGKGKTRTEAIVNLYVAVMPDVEVPSEG